MSERRAFSVAIFACHQGKVLLIEHRRLRTWLPVGGEIEAGETPLEAAERELFEETGLRGRFRPLPGAIEGAPPGLLGYEEHQAGSKGLHMNFAFVADVDTDAVSANQEIVDFAWVANTDGVDCPGNVRQLVDLALQPAVETLVRRWLAAYNARDLPALLALFSDDAVHSSPKIPERTLRGRAALERWWRAAMERLPDLHYRELRLIAAGDTAVLEYLREQPNEPPLHVAQKFVRRGSHLCESHVFHGVEHH